MCLCSRTNHTLHTGRTVPYSPGQERWCSSDVALPRTDPLIALRAGTTIDHNRWLNYTYMYTRISNAAGHGIEHPCPLGSLHHPDVALSCSVAPMQGYCYCARHRTTHLFGAVMVRRISDPRAPWMPSLWWQEIGSAFAISISAPWCERLQLLTTLPLRPHQPHPTGHWPLATGFYPCPHLHL